MKTLILAFVIILAGCTDAERANILSLGNEATVVCYSGGKEVFKEESSGQVKASSSGAGVFFKSKKDGKFIRAYADCIVFEK